MSKRVWLEVALNGGWTRKRQPLIPVSKDELTEEAIRCVNAGAAVIHLHAYDEQLGHQNDDPAVYADVIKNIKREVDAIVYPTVGQLPTKPDSLERYAPIETLCKEGLLEWSVIDPGSVNFSNFDDIKKNKIGYVYTNSEQHIRNGFVIAQQHKLHPSFAIYEPGFIRLGAALFKSMTGVPMPIYRFMFTDAFAFGLPPERFALETYLTMMQREHPEAPWMTAGRCSEISALIAPTVAAGGHIRIGLEDAPLGTKLTNLDWVNKTVDLIEKAGGSMANAKEIRQSLGTQSQ